MLTLLERLTKELAEPVFEWRGLDRGDTTATVKSATELADSTARMTWEDLLRSFEPVTSQVLAT